MYGVIAAGGTGSRLGPLTAVTNKHLLPLHDKPMIFYPLATLMAAGVRDVVIVTSPEVIADFEHLLGRGAHLGISISYVAQNRANGVADVIRVAREQVQGESFAFMLGDNFFHGPGLGRQLAEIRPETGGHVFAARVRNPSEYGVVALNDQGNPVDIVEKPEEPPSDLAVPGLYFYAADVWPYVESLRPSARGELEISDLNRALLQDGVLSVEVLPRGTVWLDAGTVEALAGASEFISVIQRRQGQLVGSPEEIALVNGWISSAELLSLAEVFGQSPYGKSLRSIIAH